MQKLKFNHEQNARNKVFKTGLICVHYTHEQHGVDVHVLITGKSSTMLILTYYIFTMSWSRI